MVKFDSVTITFNLFFKNVPGPKGKKNTVYLKERYTRRQPSSINAGDIDIAISFA